MSDILNNMDLIEGSRRIKGFRGGAVHEIIRLGASYMKGYSFKDKGRFKRGVD